MTGATTCAAGLRVLHTIAPGLHGGAESVVRMLAAGLADRGHRVVLAMTLDPEVESHPLEGALGAAGVEVVSWRLGPRAYGREAVRLARLCERIRPDAVHSHGYRADILASIVARSRTPRLVSTVHGFTGGDRKNRLYEWMQRLAFRRRFDAVVAVARPVAERLKETGVREDRIRVIRNAWSATQGALDRRMARERLGLSEATFVVGWVGRLSPEKGPEVFAEAIRRMDDLPLRAVMIGDGPARGPLERMAPAAGGRLRLLGPVENAGRLFAAFDVFVLSSRTEGTPIVLFEAMAAEVPIIATDVGGVGDVVTRTEAELVPSGDPRALEMAIRRAYEDREGMRERARLARRRLETECSPEEWLTAHERLYATGSRAPAAHAPLAAVEERVLSDGVEWDPCR